MARPQRVDDATLIERLSRTFRAVGYEGASLARLAQAVGMQKPSLYHRFPGGKQQMAEEVLAAARAWYVDHILAPLSSGGSPAERVGRVAQALDLFYDGGRQACLLNLLAQPPAEDSPFAEAIRDMFLALIGALADVSREAGMPDAEERAVRAAALLHGSLVLSRGMGTTAPFAAFTRTLGRELGVGS